MKSQQVENAGYIADKSGYGPLEVLSSAAGYYIGTMYTNVEPDGHTWQEPGSRDSDYFRTHAEAEGHLTLITKGIGNPRLHP